MGARKRLTGEVVSNAMDKTVVVKVVRISEHPLYRKKIRKASRFSAHDENGICAVGDRVLIEETRPLSKTKRWRVVVGDRVLIEETRPLSKTKRWRVVTVLQKARVEGGEEVDSVENYA